jgi:hypothetical protein
VTERAAPVLDRAQSWAELERGLADHGLSARVHRGGLQFTDGLKVLEAVHDRERSQERGQTRSSLDLW